MTEYFPIEKMEFLHIADATVVDFSSSKDLITILGYNKETNDLLRIDPDGLYENTLQEGARIVITKNVKDGKFVINHMYDISLLESIKSSLNNAIKDSPSNCASSCINECMDFCSYNCSSNCSSGCAMKCSSGCVSSSTLST